ncbi:MAG: arylamine N-acetyltransferase [Acidobacteriia bacterium]|nr:arylamine N-acetyltransferase [Terriglobia bacterium]
MEIKAYLQRIGYVGEVRPTAATLRALHRAHLFAVPFENLDIHLGRKIICDEARFLHKIVSERRGGFCYELNGAFAALLRALGFQVTLLSARVARADGSHGPEFDHLTLRVDLEEPWLADVGFGDNFLEPLCLKPGLEQRQIGRIYRLTDLEGVFHVEVRADDKWKPAYSFTLQPRQVSDFAAMCHYQQTSPDSHFTRNRICSKATAEGRVTLSDDNLIETRNGVRNEQVVTGDQEWRALLQERFGVDLP